MPAPIHCCVYSSPSPSPPLPLPLPLPSLSASASSLAATVSTTGISSNTYDNSNSNNNSNSISTPKQHRSRFSYRSNSSNTNTNSICNSNSNSRHNKSNTMSQDEVMSDILECNNRAVQHLKRGNSSEAVLILLKTVFKLRKARATYLDCDSNSNSSDSESNNEGNSNIHNCSPLQSLRRSTNPATFHQRKRNTTARTSRTRTRATSETSEDEQDTTANTSPSRSIPNMPIQEQPERMEQEQEEEEEEEDFTSSDSFLATVPLSDWPKTRSHNTRSSSYNNSNNNNNGDSTTNNLSTEDTGNLPENVFMLFDQAFIAQSEMPIADINQDLTYAFILFNTGLALHVKGMTERNDKHASYNSLNLAVKFYKIALGVLEHGATGQGNPTEIVLLLLSLFNNLGHICSHVADMKEALHCVQWLRSLVNAKSSLLLPHLREEHSFFTLSVLIPPGSEFSLAPAA